MTWLLSPSGWPVFADTGDEQTDLLGRGYDVIAEDDVQAAIDAFHAAEASPPSTQLPGWALASDVAAALATKANASSLPGKLSISDIGVPESTGGTALRTAFGSTIVVVGAGIDPTGVADSYAGIAAKIAQIPDEGGTLLFPPGTYKISQTLNFDDRPGIYLQGGGSARIDPARGLRDTAPTRIVYTGTGRAISARNGSYGFTMADLEVTYTNSGLTGRLVDVSGQVDPNPTMFPSFYRCLIGGDYSTNLRTARACLFLGNTVSASLIDCVFHDAQYGVEGYAPGEGYIFATEATFSGVTFMGLAVAGVLNPHTNWKFLAGTVFEPAYGGAAGGIVCEEPADTLILDGVGIWDTTLGGYWIDFRGYGLFITNSRVELGSGGSTLVRFNGTCSRGGIDSSHVFGADGAKLAEVAAGGSVAEWRVGPLCGIQSPVDSGSFRTPTVTPGPGVGTGGNPIVATGIDEALTLTIPTGAGAARGIMAHVEFAVPYAQPPHVLFSGQNIAGGGGDGIELYSFYVQDRTINGYDIGIWGPTIPENFTGGWTISAVVVPGLQTAT